MQVEKISFMNVPEIYNNPYHLEQADAIIKIRDQLLKISDGERQRLIQIIKPYLHFRRQVDQFLQTYFATECTASCFQSRLSACCSREGIITFFADVVINMLHTPKAEIESLLDLLQKPDNGYKCIYLGPQGCRLRIEPIVCKLFLCDQAQEQVFKKYPEARQRWQNLKQQADTYKWPDRPVLFDKMEQIFMQWGISSPLMYLHNSPGLLRIKKMAQEGQSASQNNR
jgi:hypothetical protein